MCGLCGYITKQNLPSGVLERMNNTMTHRGPDDAGIYQGSFPGGLFIGLGHRRLSILDLSDSGHQPMFTADGSLGLVYNGEIYNFRELRAGLEQKGRRFRSNCDTEVLLYLYQEYGTDCFSMLNGMFAAVFADFETGRVVLARDRAGKKPLYYFTGNAGELVFASELKPILQYPQFRKHIRQEVLSGYLCHHCIMAPNTIFEDTYKVNPGEYIVWEKGAVTRAYYWDLLERYKALSREPETDYETAKKHLKELLFDAVEKRYIADVPIGTFLSGGIDSSLITAIARAVNAEPVRSFTIGFDDQASNEAEYAKAIARYLGTEHRERYVSEEDLLGQLQDIARYYDEPFGDSSQIPSMLVSQIARQETTVILSGDGGDELFCGYEMYDWAYWAQRLDGIGRLADNALRLPGIRRLALEKRLPGKARAFLENRNPDTKVQLFTDIRENHMREMLTGEQLSAKSDLESEIVRRGLCVNDWQMRRMLLDIRQEMADDILVKMDRASMRYSLEVRCPILDYRIMEYSFRMPMAFKYSHRDKKHILKELAYEMVPRELLDRPKKGFGVPLAKWLRGPLRQRLLHYADREILKKQGIFYPEKIWEFIRKLETSDVSLYNSVLWDFYMFQLWYQTYMEDLW